MRIQGAVSTEKFMEPMAVAMSVRWSPVTMVESECALGL